MSQKPYRLVLKNGITRSLNRDLFLDLCKWRDTSKYGETLPLRDESTKEIIMSITKSDISFLGIKDDGSVEKKDYICDYGEKHDEDLRCTCHMTYNNMSGIKFYRLLREGGFEIRYPSDITAEMKTYIRRWITEHAYDNRVTNMPLEQKQEIIARAQSFKTPIPF